MTASAGHHQDTSATGVRVRDATPADRQLLATIQEQASTAALGHIFPVNEYPFPLEATVARWETFGGRVLICRVDERPVGFVGIEGPWLEGLYVLPEGWGTGIAGTLHDLALDVMRSSGVPRRGCGCWSTNTRARRFYERRAGARTARNESCRSPRTPSTLATWCRWRGAAPGDPGAGRGRLRA